MKSRKGTSSRPRAALEKQPTLYKEGRVEGLSESRGSDADPRTGQSDRADRSPEDSKLSGSRDAFVSSEVIARSRRKNGS
jgi:hypothetical protein